MEKALNILILTSFFLLNSSSFSIQKSEYSSFDESQWEMTSSKYPNQKHKAKVPGTVLGALVEQGLFGDVFMGTNLSKVSDTLFKSSWIYTKNFSIDDTKINQKGILNFEGINYKANIWLNNKLIADTNEVIGVFKTYTFTLPQLEKNNKLRVEVFPPKAGDFTIGFVDWAPEPQDKNMGIWRPVTLEFVDEVNVSNTFIRSDLNLDINQADLYLSTELSNNSGKEINGVVIIEIENIKIKKEVNLKASSNTKIKLSPQEFKALTIQKPRLWWTHTYGSPELYQAKVSFVIDDKISDTEELTFGIRKVEEYFTPEGHRGYKINGKPIMIKGGGWVDDLFLNNSTAYNENQLIYCKEMGLNTVRFEGFWGTSQEIYDLCDKHGLLAMVGFSCQWEWNEYIGGEYFDDCDTCIGGAINTDKEIDLIADYFNDMTKWLRNHPSVFLWTGGSDRLHPEALERKYLSIIEEENKGALYCGAAKTHTSKVTGPTGVKMYGPYDYVPPIYWYTDTQNGGAYGFNTETGPGPQPPNLSSIKKMIPSDSLWPLESGVWKYHNGRHAFETMQKYLDPLYARYKKPTSIEEFAYLAQVQNYELMRPMFEAFVVNKPKATGVVQWMLNSAWPETYWQLYDYYLNPTGAYYGAKKANSPLHIIYNYGDENIYISNESLQSEKLRAVCDVYNVNSEKVSHQEAILTMQTYTSERAFKKPITRIKGGYFVKLYLYKGDSLVSDNFYWLSDKMDKMANDDQATWIYTPTTQHANFNYLNKVPSTTLITKQTSLKSPEDETIITYEIKNTGNAIALFVELAIDEKILPIHWSDNYFSLLPQESKSVTVRFSKDFTTKGEVTSKWYNQ